MKRRGYCPLIRGPCPKTGLRRSNLVSPSGTVMYHSLVWSFADAPLPHKIIQADYRCLFFLREKSVLERASEQGLVCKKYYAVEWPVDYLCSSLDFARGSQGNKGINPLIPSLQIPISPFFFYSLQIALLYSLCFRLMPNLVILSWP